MRLIIGTHYAGQTSWWLNGENHRVVAWAGRTFDSVTEARRAAHDFKRCSTTAEFEVYDTAMAGGVGVPGTRSSRWQYRPTALLPNRTPDAPLRACGPTYAHPVDPSPCLTEAFVDATASKHIVEGSGSGSPTQFELQLRRSWLAHSASQAVPCPWGGPGEPRSPPRRSSHRCADRHRHHDPTLPPPRRRCSAERSCGPLPPEQPPSAAPSPTATAAAPHESRSLKHPAVVQKLPAGLWGHHRCGGTAERVSAPGQRASLAHQRGDRSRRTRIRTVHITDGHPTDSALHHNRFTTDRATTSVP